MTDCRVLVRSPPYGTPNGNYPGDYAKWAPTFSINHRSAQDAFNAAYSQFKRRLSDSAELAVTLAERKQALIMMTNRLIQIRRFTVEVRRGNFRRASQILGMSRTPSGLKAGSKRLANNWLEYHFGWSPLVSDIFGALDLLTKPIPNTRIRARGYGWETTYWTNNVDSDATEIRNVKCQLLADFWIENPNLHLASQLGFINPVSIAWELVPFSFVVDWFVNVSDIIGSMTDFAGVQFENPATTYLSNITQYKHQFTYGWNYTVKRVTMARRKGIGTPTLSLRPPGPWPWKRAVTAGALLLQILR